jgi:hypothetical protein
MARREIFHRLECQVDADLSVSGQGVVDRESGARRDGFHLLFEVVHVEFDKVALVERLLLDIRLSGKVRHNSDHERNFDLLAGTKSLYFVFDMNTRRTILFDETLPTLVRRHGYSPAIRRYVPLLSHHHRST